MDRYDIIQSIKSAVDDLEVTIRDEVRKIQTTDTLINPTDEVEFPIFSITSGPETGDVGLWGASMANTFKLDMFGFSDGGPYYEPNETAQDRRTRLMLAGEAIVKAVKEKLMSKAFLAETPLTSTSP